MQDTPMAMAIWIASTVGLLIVAIIIDTALAWGWPCTKGIVFAFLITTGLCGLIASICGNPFKPFF